MLAVLQSGPEVDFPCQTPTRTDIASQFQSLFGSLEQSSGVSLTVI